MYTVENRNGEDLPPLLKEIPDRPSNLYFKYKTFSQDIFENCLAVVGSRRMTDYGERVVNKLIPELSSYGITIVSGFMFGIDACAHKAAVECGGKSIAVMPCGIDRITPSYQHDLYNAILDEGGLVMSEYEGDSVPQKWMFTKRNRIVAGLCKGVLIVEAEESSGSLITAEYAKKYNRQLFAIPGNIFSSKSKGCNGLIKEGALPVQCSSDILSYYGINAQKHKMQVSMLEDDVQQGLLELLIEESLTSDDIVSITGLSISDVSSYLTELMLNGVVIERNGVWHVI